MDFEAWERYYVQIRKDFGFSQEDDEAVARDLDARLRARRATDADLRTLLSGKEVTVAGNGPNLEAELGEVRGLLIAADEATSVAIGKGLRPAILVTDLDGHVPDQVKANDAGAIAVVHGHGDNGPAVRTWASLFSGPTVATTQSRPSGGLRNFGGFTDGDRAAFLADHFGASRIHLIGFDFEHPNAKDLDPQIKRRKLDWAFILLSALGRDDLDL